MNLRLERREYTTECIIGQLFIDGWFECYTLEDISRTVKVAGETSIPEGKYKVIIDYSNRFKKDLIHILDVPGFEGIRIHAGNTAADTSGCILVGQIKGINMILASNLALNPLQKKVHAAIDSGESVDITVEGVK